MIHNEPFPLKNYSLWFLLICAGLIVAYLFFIAFITVWVGLTHLQQHGFWMPILAGTLIILFSLFLFYRLSKLILNRTKELDIINNF